jgi:3-oxoacyl-[acyl-carrier protein] reductase
MLRKGGAIVNVTSVVGEMGNAGQSAYAMAKAGLIGLTKSLARELGSRSIRVNAVSPGFVETDMTRDLPAEAKSAMLANTPLGRVGSAEEIAEAIAFLAGPRASYITGEILRVNGGLYI